MTTKDLSAAGVVRIVMPPTSPASSNYRLFKHMYEAHNLTLLNSELEDIIALCGGIIRARESKNVEVRE